MPRPFDNLEHSLLPALQQTLAVSHRADFSVGHLNLRNRDGMDDLVEQCEEDPSQEPQIICSLDLASTEPADAGGKGQV